MDINFIFSIVVLILSVVVHELAHGYAADTLGDETPRLQGRLTLNPFKHLDPIGSFILPVLTYNVGGFIFGWAKPVEFNPYNLNRSAFIAKWGEAIIAFAGPLTNFLIALLFGTLIRFAHVFPLDAMTISLMVIIVMVNVSLACFNLIPIPPLDGSKILFAFLPARFDTLRASIERYGFIIFILFVILSGSFLSPIIQGVGRFFIGI
jgi:Zn-dependent protease